MHFFGGGGNQFGAGRDHADGAVLARLLGLVEAAIREGENLFVADGVGIVREPGKRGPAQRAGAIDRFPGAVQRKGRVGDRGENALGQQFGFVAVGVAGDDEEFFPTPAQQHVGVANGRAEAAGHFDEHPVADVVTIAVVDFLEVVDVDQIENQIAGMGIVVVDIGAQRLADVAFDGGGEVAAVAQAGQRIGE